MDGDLIFFFQAEDGIRYLVRSRGLGDVYKRQFSYFSIICNVRSSDSSFTKIISILLLGYVCNIKAVSYTHLTLPTSDLV